MEEALGAILTDHFENAHNPHETIYRVWLLLNADALTKASLEGAVNQHNVGEPTYN